MLSDEKISHLTHRVMKRLMEIDTVDFTEEEPAIWRIVKRAIQAQVQEGADMEAAVKRKIESLSRNVVEGSPEWDVLYHKFFKEEENRRGLQ